MSTLAISVTPSLHALELTIKDVEAVAIQNDPLIVQFQAKSQALMEESVAVGQLPDPTLQFGLEDLSASGGGIVPDMTRAVLGLQQVIPPSGMLAQDQERMLLMAEAERARAVDRALTILREVRKAWMEIYFQSQAAALVKENEDIFDQLVKVTQYQYRAGRGLQQDVLAAELELSLLRDRALMIQQEREKAIADLEKWTGAPVRKHTFAIVFPELPALPPIEELDQRIDSHPSVAAEKAMLGAARKGVAVERTKFRPMWMVGVNLGYNLEQGEADPTMGAVAAPRDYVSAMVSLNLPFFTEKRQNKRLNARGHEVNAANDAVDAQRRELKRELDANYAEWKRLTDRLDFYKTLVLEQSAQYAEAVRKSYQSRVSDFSELVRARQRDLDSNLEALRLKVNQAKSHYELQYVAGESGT